MKWYKDPVYIEMCDCPEIQGLWKPAIGDYIAGEWFIDDKDTMGLCYKGIVTELNPEGHSDCVSTGGSIFWAIKSHIWLPRQDQLQAIVEDILWKGIITPAGRWASGTISSFNRNIFEGENACYYSRFKPMEQLWISFVMKEKFNQVWTVEGWQ